MNIRQKTFPYTVTMLVVVILVSLITLVQGNGFKKILSERVHSYLRDQYKDNPNKCECMIEYFRRINIWEKFYSEDIVGQQTQLVRDLRPYIEDADGSKENEPYWLFVPKKF